jgi:hypothetical protein
MSKTESSASPEFDFLGFSLPFLVARSVPLGICEGVLAFEVPWGAGERMCSTSTGEDMGVEDQEGCGQDTLLIEDTTESAAGSEP